MPNILVIDDVRVARDIPDTTFTHVRHPIDALREVYTKKYDEIWLDHDMGYDETGELTPIEVVRALAYDDTLVDYGPIIIIHSLNPVGVAKFKHILESEGRRVHIPSIYLHNQMFEKEF